MLLTRSFKVFCNNLLDGKQKKNLFKLCQFPLAKNGGAYLTFFFVITYIFT